MIGGYPSSYNFQPWLPVDPDEHVYQTWQFSCLMWKFELLGESYKASLTINQLRLGNFFPNNYIYERQTCRQMCKLKF